MDKPLFFLHLATFLAFGKRIRIMKDGVYETRFNALRLVLLRLNDVFFDRANFEMFTATEKKFIVKAFGRNPSPTKVRHDFLKQ